MVKRIINQDGNLMVIDSAGTKNKQNITLIREVAAYVDSLTIDDEGAFFNLDATSGEEAGGGKGLYIYEETALKKVGGGECSPVLCQYGEPLLRSTQIKGAKFIPLTADAGVVFSAPILPDGYPGQEVTLMNVGDYDIELHSESLLPNSNLKLHSDLIRLKAVNTNAYAGCLRLVYSSTVGAWIQVGEPQDLQAALHPELTISASILTLVEIAPVVRRVELQTPLVAALTLSGVAPEPWIQIRCQPGVAALTMTGIAGSFADRITANAASLTLTGIASVIA